MTPAIASSPTAPAEAPDKGVVCDALVSSSSAQTVSLAPNKYVRVIAPGIDITAKLTSEQVTKLVQFTLEMIAPPSGYNGPG